MMNEIIPSREYSSLEEGKRNVSKRMLLKVCGMKYPENIAGLIQLTPDFIGFIFYSKSSRFVSEMDVSVIKKIPATIQKVGVFVNASIAEILQTSKKYGLDYVQLHGEEDVDFVKKLKAEDIKVIKVFRITDQLPEEINQYDSEVDLFLFDTATKAYGGSGKKFDWNLLKYYDQTTPYLLSGGIGLDDVKVIEEMELKGLIGIDVNSKFEIEPANKNLNMISQLKAMI